MSTANVKRMHTDPGYSSAKKPARRRNVPMPSNYQRVGLIRDFLPNPRKFYSDQGIKLLGLGTWRDACCPFHRDSNPSLRVHVATGAYRCMVCGAKGGDVLAFYRARYGVGFVEAAQALDAWGTKP